jgi:hypothetical protein
MCRTSRRQPPSHTVACAGGRLHLQVASQAPRWQPALWHAWRPRDCRLGPPHLSRALCLRSHHSPSRALHRRGGTVCHLPGCPAHTHSVPVSAPPGQHLQRHRIHRIGVCRGGLPHDPGRQGGVLLLRRSRRRPIARIAGRRLPPVPMVLCGGGGSGGGVPALCRWSHPCCPCDDERAAGTELVRAVCAIESSHTHARPDAEPWSETLEHRWVIGVVASASLQCATIPGLGVNALGAMCASCPDWGVVRALPKTTRESPQCHNAHRSTITHAFHAPANAACGHCETPAASKVGQAMRVARAADRHAIASSGGT